MKRYFGAHVSAAGGLANAIRNGSILGVNTIQIHPTPPQRWLYKAFAPGIENEFVELRRSSCVEKVFFHGVYLINLATPDEAKFKPAVRSLEYYLDLSERMDVQGTIFHVGSNRDQESDEAGYKQAAAAINGVLEAQPGRGRLLLEVAAGSGDIIGDRLEELRTIYEMIEDKERVGFALDTQHLWASGYDLAARLEEFIQEVEQIFTLPKVWAIHVNDSKTDLGSRSDRHENLGEGKIGREALIRFINHPKLAGIPMILETPGLKDLETAVTEVSKLREIVNLP